MMLEAESDGRGLPAAASDGRGLPTIASTEDAAETTTIFRVRRYPRRRATETAVGEATRGCGLAR